MQATEKKRPTQGIPEKVFLPDVPAQGVLNRTLVTVRWVAVCGQSAALLVSYFVLNLPIPLWEAFGVVALSALVNFGTIFATRHDPAYLLSPFHAALFLGFDILQLTSLLCLTGGLFNPFALLLFAPLTVAASLLPARHTAGLAALACGCVSVLSVWYVPLPRSVFPVGLSDIFILGQWVAFVFSSVFIAAYVWRMSAHSRRLAHAYGESRRILERERKLAALGAQAATAAHELGSPLNTLTLVATELAREIPEDSPLAEDIALLVSQTARCRDILAAFARNPEEKSQDPLSPVSPDVLMTLAAEPHQIENPAVAIRIIRSADSSSPVPQIAASLDLIHALGHLIQNAIQFAQTAVTITLFWDKSIFSVTIQDDGDGFSQAALKRIGEPYFSAHRSAGRSEDSAIPRVSHHMGLGVFIARTTLEMTGARLIFSNHFSNDSSPRGALSSSGAKILVTWARKDIEFRAPSP